MGLAHRTSISLVAFRFNIHFASAFSHNDKPQLPTGSKQKYTAYRFITKHIHSICSLVELSAF